MGYMSISHNSFLPKGHTKFGPDWGFGIAKQKYKLADIATLDELKYLIDHSCAQSNLNTAFLVGQENGTVLAPVYDWDMHLSKCPFRKIPGITKCHYFQISSTDPDLSCQVQIFLE